MTFRGCTHQPEPCRCTHIEIHTVIHGITLVDYFLFFLLKLAAMILTSVSVNNKLYTMLRIMIHVESFFKLLKILPLSAQYIYTHC